MSNLIRSYRDVWCSHHHHLQSDWECNLMFDLGYFGKYASELAKEHLINVTVEVKKDED